MKTLEEQINESGKTLEKVKKKEMKLEKRIKEKKANYRLNLYLVVFIIMTGFLQGFFGRKVWENEQKIFFNLIMLDLFLF